MEAREREAKLDRTFAFDVEQEGKEEVEEEEVENSGGVEARRECCGSNWIFCCDDAYGARGELLVSRGEVEVHLGGDIRFALRDVRRGEGVCGVK